MMRTRLRDEFELLLRIGALDEGTAPRGERSWTRGELRQRRGSPKRRVTQSKIRLLVNSAVGHALVASAPIMYETLKSAIPAITARQREVVELIAEAARTRRSASASVSRRGPPRLIRTSSARKLGVSGGARSRPPTALPPAMTHWPPASWFTPAAADVITASVPGLPERTPRTRPSKSVTVGIAGTSP